MQPDQSRPGGENEATRWCVVVPVRVENRPGFLWRWRSDDGGVRSPFCFTYFHECIEDAQRAGYVIDMPRTLECARRPEVVAVDEYRRAPQST